MYITVVELINDNMSIQVKDSCHDERKILFPL